MTATQTLQQNFFQLLFVTIREMLVIGLCAVAGLVVVGLGVIAVLWISAKLTSTL